MDFSTKLTSLVSRVEKALDELLPPFPLPMAGPRRIHEAMRYSLQAGGKRLRPVLLIAAYEALIDHTRAAPSPLPAAVAMECIHTYTLIHDDLPCMDNDDLRRGRPTAHRQFDEATALLAGDALLTYAFQLLANHYKDTPDILAKVIHTMADASGSLRLIGGQMQDLIAEKQSPNPEDLDYIHRNKTAALVQASLVSGGQIAGAPDEEIEKLNKIGLHLGLAFQIIDDILDTTADAATLGKTPGKDAAAGKTTHVTLHGLQNAREAAARETRQALATIDSLSGDSAFLHQLAEHMLERKY